MKIKRVRMIKDKKVCISLTANLFNNNRRVRIMSIEQVG